MTATFMHRIVVAGLLLIGPSVLAQTQSTHASSNGHNLVLNSSFEELEGKKLVAWKPLFRGVNEEERAKYVKNATFIVSSTAFSGGRSAGIKVKDIPSNLAFAYWEETVPVKPNKRYRLSAMIRQEGEGKIWMVVAGKNKDFRKAEGGNSVKAPAEAGGKFVKATMEVSCGGETHYASIELRATGGAMTAWFDDVTLEEVP